MAVHEEVIPETREFGAVASWTVAVAVGVTSMSFNCWWPFLPLYAIELGAKSDADALFWMAVATSAQGVARLASGPVWGVLSDRYGRKMMFLRALYLSSLIGAVAAFVSAPWQIAIPLGLAGLVSGFNPAAVALVSVSVPDYKLNSSLSQLTGAQYVGNMAGPAFGAVLALVLDYRAAILFASIIPLITATAVVFLVPRDRTGRRMAVVDGETDAGGKVELEPFTFTFQFGLAVLLYFMIFALNQLIRLVTPIALRAIEGSDVDVSGAVGITFTLGGLVSAISVLLIAPRLFKPGKLRTMMVAGFLLAAVGQVLAGVATTTVLYVTGFLAVAMVMSAITPTTATLVAANATRSRRGTAFGIASSAQALSFAIGPIFAAVFAAVSLTSGFFVIAGVMVAMAVLIYLRLREPNLSEAL